MKKKTLIIIAAVLILFTISAIVFYDDYMYIISSIAHPSKICFPDSSKDKVTVIIAKNGIYDNEKISLQVSNYFDSVKKDLNIDNAGLKRFSGKTVDKLDKFVDEIYTNDNVGYIILLGDDLPIFGYTEVIDYTKLPIFSDTEVIDIDTNITYPTTNPNDTGICLVNDSKSGKVISLITSASGCGPPAKYNGLDGEVDNKLSCVSGDCRVITESCESEVCPVRTGNGGYYRCRDVAISYILPPLLYSESEKVDFVSKILETYADYHNNFDTVISKYQKSMLIIEMADSVKSEPITGYYLPIVALAYVEGEKISNELKNKHLILFLGVHGAPDLLLFGIGIPNQVSVSLGEYSKFSKRYGTPALFVDAGQCHAFDIGYEDSRHCCWPQVFMESGVWAYYGFGYGQGIEAKLTHEKTIGLAVREGSPTQIFIFGDILAHMK